MLKAAKIFLWTLMAIVLAMAAATMCTLRMISPRQLTAITTAAANRILDAKVDIANVELSLSGRLPLLSLRVDSVTVISKPMLRLDSATRATLPAWADTLVTIGRFEGGINLGALLRGKIDLYDVEFDRPCINLVDVNDSLSNYVIYSYHPSEPDTTSATMPHISINRFSIVKPGPLRFDNVATGEHFTLALKTLSVENSGAPAYSLDVSGDMNAPALSVYNLDNLAFGASGSLDWDPEKPTELAIRGFRLSADVFRADVSAIVDFARQINVKEYSLSVPATPVSDIVGLLPDTLRRSYGLTPAGFDTDIKVALDLRSTAPFNLSTDSIPAADIDITLTPGALRYGKARFRDISGSLAVSLAGNALDSATATARDLRIAGPATDLLLNLSLSHPLSDPVIEGSVEGSTELSRLPSQLTDPLNGYLAGRLRADIRFKAAQSMLTQQDFHRIHLTGSLLGSGLYYLSSDTATMLSANRLDVDFGTHTAIRNDRFLTAVVKVDSADILHTQYSMKVADFRLGVGVSNRAPSADTTVIIPMGGDLSLGKFYLTVLGDSLAFNMRGTHGRVTMQRFRGNKRLPQFSADLDVRHISTGSPTMRFMLSGAGIHANAHKLPSRKIPEAVRRTADSIHVNRPDLPIDSVYRRAIEIQRHKRHGKYPRIHPEYTAEETEIIDWGTSRLVRRLLLGWDIRGSLKARRASLFTPFFPLRNRVRDFNVEFSNDTVHLTNVKYKAGSSDFLVSGQITNMKRGFTRKGFRSPLKINFEVISDTIDVNELANSTFRGSAYAAARDTEGHRDFSIDALVDAEERSDEDFEREVGRIVANSPDSMSPLLIPTNIDAKINIRADNILYADLLFHRFSGELLASRGALNIHDLTASSDVGGINLSALYSAPSASDLKFGFGMKVNDFNISRFTRLLPALDSIMPLLHDFSGIIDADIAATCDIDRAMNLELPTLAAAIRISGDSLRLIDPETYRKVGKWLMFKDRQDNLIRHMNVEMTVKDNMLRLYPFIFDLDRYKLGVQGHNDLALNFNYHIAVLKSPLPFKFGVNISGNPDKYKVRLGKARLNEKQASASVAIVDTTRINLLTQLENIFRNGVRNSRFARLNISSKPTAAEIDLNADTITHSDSLILIREGLIPAPLPPQQQPTKEKSKKRKK